MEFTFPGTATEYLFCFRSFPWHIFFCMPRNRHKILQSHSLLYRHSLICHGPWILIRNSNMTSVRLKLLETLHRSHSLLPTGTNFKTLEYLNTKSVYLIQILPAFSPVLTMDLDWILDLASSSTSSLEEGASFQYEWDDFDAAWSSFELSWNYGIEDSQGLTWSPQRPPRPEALPGEVFPLSIQDSQEESWVYKENNDNSNSWTSLSPPGLLISLNLGVSSDLSSSSSSQSSNINSLTSFSTTNRVLQPDICASPPRSTLPSRICAKTFNKKDYLNRHISTHTKLIKCPGSECAMQMKKRRDMERHLRAQHPNLAQELGLSLPSRETCPIPWCKRSKKGFSRHDNLVRHIKKLHSRGPYIHKN